MADIVIRRANNQDIDRLIELYKLLMVDQVSKDRFHKGTVQHPSWLTEHVINMVQFNSSCVVVAELNGLIIGFIEACLEDKEEHFNVDDFVYICNFYVDDQYRNQDILFVMHRLYKEVENWTIGQQRKYIVADVYYHNDRIMKFLERINLTVYKYRVAKELK